MMAYAGLVFRILIFAIISILLVSFVLSNNQQVALRLYPLATEVVMPLFALAGLVFVFGLLFGMTLMSLRYVPSLHKTKRDINAKKKEISALKQEITALEIEQNASQQYPHPGDSSLIFPANKAS
jgi:uncharacterized integral membrane protein